jgi:hypothetical protein
VTPDSLPAGRRPAGWVTLPREVVALCSSHTLKSVSRNRIAPPGSRIAGGSPRRIQRSTVSAETLSWSATVRAGQEAAHRLISVSRSHSAEQRSRRVALSSQASSGQARAGKAQRSPYSALESGVQGASPIGVCTCTLFQPPPARCARPLSSRVLSAFPTLPSFGSRPTARASEARVRDRRLARRAKTPGAQESA